MAYAQCVPISAQILALFPKPLRGIVAPLVTLPRKMYERTWFRLTLKEV